MSNDKINEAIAKACGYTWMTRHDGSQALSSSEDVLISPPNYCESLDAMCEAETSSEICKIGYAKYIEILKIACGTDRLGALVFATARQRAEAFLKTLNLWRNE